MKKRKLAVRFRFELFSLDCEESCTVRSCSAKKWARVIVLN